MGRILIDGLEFYAFHGYFKEEQKIGGKYIVDVELSTDFSNAVNNDKLDDTINYAEVVGIIGEEMKISSKLIEHVAGRIIKRIMNEFIAIDYIRLKVVKVNPPIPVKLKSVSVVLEKYRDK